MKIEAGKYYKTRDGRKARVYVTDAENRDFPVHGFLSGEQLMWTLEGTFYVSLDPSVRDLVSEWVEPKPRLLAYGDSGIVRVIPETDTPGISWYRLPHLDEPKQK